MKKIEDQTVVNTVVECLKWNAALKAGEQKDAKTIAIDIATAFAELDRKLVQLSPAPSRNTSRVRQAEGKRLMYKQPLGKA